MDLIEIDKGWNPFKPMVDKNAMHTAQEKISEAHRAPSSLERHVPPPPKPGMGTGAKVAGGAAGVFGTTAAVAGGIWAARKIAQRRAAAAIEAAAAEKKAATAAKHKKTAIIGGSALTAGVVAPSAYKLYREKQGAA